jgi:hypothetical protein
MSEDDNLHIRMRITLPDGTNLEKNFEPNQQMKLGVEEDSLESTTTKQSKPGDVAFSGHHDHGPLPPPREGGPFAQLMECVIQAKAFSDNYLTEIIKQEKMMSSQDQDQSSQDQQRKKARVRK